MNRFQGMCDRAEGVQWRVDLRLGVFQAYGVLWWGGVGWGGVGGGGGVGGLWVCAEYKSSPTSALLWSSISGPWNPPIVKKLTNFAFDLNCE